jgi:hypothetical protein
VRWTGRLRATVTDTYTITFVSDDGVRLYFNGDTNSAAINDWNNHLPKTDSFQVALNAGQSYSIVIEYYQRGGGAVAQLYWAIGGGDRVIVPSSQLYAQWASESVFVLEREGAVSYLTHSISAC